MHLATSCQNKREENNGPRQGICLGDYEHSNCNHNPESKRLVSSVSILFSRSCVHLWSLPHSLLTTSNLASCVSNFQVTLRAFIEIRSLCHLLHSRECLVFSNTLWPVNIQLAISALFLQLAEVVLSISSIAAGISYTKRIKREVPIPRQLGCYRLSCFDYSH